MTSRIEPTSSTTVRVDDRAVYDRKAIHAVFDEALVSHVGFVDGRPLVIPMLHARVGDVLYLHGSPATRFFRSLKKGPWVCVTATLVDGLVLARSAFHHSANYRSAMVLGRPEPVGDLDRRREVLEAFTDRLVSGRQEHLRPMTEKEVRATAVLGVPIDEASAKARTGPPLDDPEDLGVAVWSGVLPIRSVFGEPLDDPANRSGQPVPEHVKAMVSR